MLAADIIKHRSARAVSADWQKVGRNDTQTEDERESESVCLQGAQHWRYIASILPGVLLRVGQGHFMVAVCLSRPQFSCHTENWKSILHEHKHTLSAVSFYLQHFFWKPCSPLLKTSQHKLFGCQKKKPPPREVFSLPASTMTVLMLQEQTAAFGALVLSFLSSHTEDSTSPDTSLSLLSALSTSMTVKRGSWAVAESWRCLAAVKGVFTKVSRFFTSGSGQNRYS